MSNPKTQSAYQRWEIGSLKKEIATNKEALMIAKNEGYEIGLEEGRAACLLEGVEAGRTEGMIDGLVLGTAQGYAEALAEGRERNLLMSQQFSELINNFELELQQAKENTAQQILELCLDMSKAMLKTALVVRPELILPVINQALQSLPSVQLPATLYLNAADLELVQLAIGDDLKLVSWRLISDKQIEAGGCRLETATIQIDITLPSRWQQLLNALGKSGEWLSQDRRKS
jgi:flagellar assembly protein FliH